VSTDTAVSVQQFMAKNKMAAIPHPPYSPGLAPSDFVRFPKLKLISKKRHIMRLLSKFINQRNQTEFQWLQNLIQTNRIEEKYV
jgi:hypothetical protein